MKLNKVVTIVALTISAGALGSDFNTIVNNYGVMNGQPGYQQITPAQLQDALNLIGGNANSYNASEQLRALSAVLRANLSTQSNIQTLGNTPAFEQAFSADQAGAKANLAALITSDDNNERNLAIGNLNAIIAASTGSATAAAGGAGGTTAAAGSLQIGGYSVNNEDEAALAIALLPGGFLYDYMKTIGEAGRLTGNDLVADARSGSEANGTDIAALVWGTRQMSDDQETAAVKRALRRLGARSY